jgi:hypothetical protein
VLASAATTALEKASSIELSLILLTCCSQKICLAWELFVLAQALFEHKR